MTVKWVEIRDRGTTIPALAIQISEADGWLAERAGYGPDGCVLLINLALPVCEYDPFAWTIPMGRTMHYAHRWLADHFDQFVDGDVLDVEFILGETAAPKRSDKPIRSDDDLNRLLDHLTGEN